MESKKAEILVIKFGGLKEIVFSAGAFAAIRKAYDGKAHIVLLTSAPYKAFAEQSGYFDEIWIDEMPSIFGANTFFDMLNKIKSRAFDGIFDLQRDFRSNLYLRLFGKEKPEWSGSLSWCARSYIPPKDEPMHMVQCLANQLFESGIEEIQELDLSWLTSDISKFNINVADYALIALGVSDENPDKMWNDQKFADLAIWLSSIDIIPVFVGLKGELNYINSIKFLCSKIRAFDLVGKTTISELAELARGATFAFGHDTDALHLIAALECPTLMMISKESDPIKDCPIGRDASIIEYASLNDLESDEIIVILSGLLEDMANEEDEMFAEAIDEEIEKERLMENT